MDRTDFIIAGPTASGKSDFAHALARRIGGVVINCDSVQIYRGIENISASPLADATMIDGAIDGVPYELFSILPLSDRLSAAEYQARARACYDAAVAAGRPAVFVGGTGFYINAITRGLSPMPDIDEDVRARARKMVADDLDAVRAMPGAGCAGLDAQRAARALEVFLQTGRAITEFQAAPRVGAFLGHARRVLINPPADLLRARIAARIPRMMSGGALAEAQNIIATGDDPSRAIGAVQLVQYLRGEIDFDTCVQNWITKTNQYAKRQRTWFRTQFAPDVIINRVPDLDADVRSLID